MARPLVLFHAPSAGEARQAEPVIRILRHRHPEWQLAFTHFSPSAESVAPALPVDVAGFLPYDRVSESGTLLDILQPSAVVITKLDVWPELATQATERGVPVALIAATVRPGSARLRWPASAVLKRGYAALASVGAVHEEDAARLVRLGTNQDRIRVLGDPRFDGVAERVASIPADDPLLSVGSGAWTIVAGSTWPGDEAVLLKAYAGFRSAWPDARLVIVPHEPLAPRIAALSSLTAQLGLPKPSRIVDTGELGALLVEDRLGKLATLYGAARVAHVGGGFGRSGLHSVLEAAVWGVPVTFGPSTGGTREAGLLEQNGAALSVADADQLRSVWERWRGEETLRVQAGCAARSVVERGRGAAERSAALVEALVIPSPQSRPQTSPIAAPRSPG